MRYRIALCGFSEFEYRALHFSFQHPASTQEVGYDVVDALADAEFAVVDADSKPAVKGVVLSGRVAHAVFVGTMAPPGAPAHLQRPIDPSRILRALDEVTGRHAASAPKPRLDPALLRDLPTLDDVVVPTIPGALASAAAPQSSAATPATPASAPSTAARSEAKAAARSAARRARLANSRLDARLVDPLCEVLVLDSDVTASSVLCTLLERFGFNAYSVRSIAQANEQLAARPFAAIFLDIEMDGQGVALLQQIQALPALQDHPAPAVVMVATYVSPAERVRASLAGVGAPLIKPLSRGDVARALEARGVALPADARRN